MFLAYGLVVPLPDAIEAADDLTPLDGTFEEEEREVDDPPTPTACGRVNSKRDSTGH